jgi:hypothetical protein
MRGAGHTDERRSRHPSKALQSRIEVRALQDAPDA